MPISEAIPPASPGSRTSVVPGNRTNGVPAPVNRSSKPVSRSNGAPVPGSPTQPPAAPPPSQPPQAEDTDTLAGKHTRGKRGCRGCLITILIVLLAFAAVTGFLVWRISKGSISTNTAATVSFGAIEAPAERSDNITPVAYSRKDGVSTVLMAGTDADGLRTDTIMLLYMDSNGGIMGLLSIPRDTLVYGGYSVPKINSAYGWAGCGEAGMEELMDRVQDLIGYRPDSYVLIQMQTLVDMVDLMGGVEYNVPMDMQYSDPYQDLVIDLHAGPQTLNGEQAIGLLRFRSGYAMADLQRVQVQRDFIQTAVKQWSSPVNVWKLPQALSLVQSEAVTDLDNSNLMWVIYSLFGADLDQTVTETLPGAGASFSSGSYFVADPAQVLALINASFNIYQQDLTADMLNIRTG